MTEPRPVRLRRGDPVWIMVFHRDFIDQLAGTFDCLSTKGRMIVRLDGGQRLRVEGANVTARR